MRFLSKVPKIDFMGRRNLMIGFSVAASVVAVVMLLTRGLTLGIDFSGGVLVEVSYPEKVQLEDIRTALANGGYAGASVQHFGTASDVMIRLAPDEAEDSAQTSARVLEALAAAGAAPELRRIEFVGAAVGEELAVDGSLAALIALIGILIYVAFRFEWKFALGAIVATVHDALVVLGWFALFGLEFDLTVLAAVLAMIGYSLNDTIVVYDRVRENFLEMRRAEPIPLINVSLNQTLARTIVTGGTTLMVLTSLMVAGGAAVHNFSIALIVGIVIGTYSSIFVASSMLVWLGVTREDLLPPTDETETDGMP